jgi:hypothetical protein
VRLVVAGTLSGAFRSPAVEAMLAILVEVGAALSARTAERLKLAA